MVSVMNNGHITWIRLITVIGITFAIVIWGLLIFSLLMSYMGGDYRLFDRITAPIGITSWVGALFCGVISLKRNSVVGWSLVANAIAAFIFSLFIPEL